MREILFKAKRIDNGDWVEGYYLAGMMLAGCGGEKTNYIIEENGYYWPIDTETLCQYTGLNDKNGSRIWENDIVKCSRRKGHDFFKVIWRKNYVDFGIERIGFGVQYPFGQGENNKDIYGYHYEIVGNIFDNPELLEGMKIGK